LISQFLYNKAADSGQDKGSNTGASK